MLFSGTSTVFRQQPWALGNNIHPVPFQEQPRLSQDHTCHFGINTAPMPLQEQAHLLGNKHASFGNKHGFSETTMGFGEQHPSRAFPRATTSSQDQTCHLGIKKAPMPLPEQARFFGNKHAFFGNKQGFSGTTMGFGEQHPSRAFQRATTSFPRSYLPFRDKQSSHASARTITLFREQASFFREQARFFGNNHGPVSYTHLTLPTNREV